MKAYLITTGTVFGVIALMHLAKAIQDWPLLKTHLAYYSSMAILGVVAAGLSAWAWRLLRSTAKA